MSTAEHSEPLRVTTDHAGHTRLSFADRFPPRTVLEILRRDCNARIISRAEDPLSDWVDLELSIKGVKLTLSAEYWGTELCASTDEASRALESLAPCLRDALSRCSLPPTSGQP